MLQMPFSTARIPAPEPPPWTLISTVGYLWAYSSTSSSANGCTKVDPVIVRDVFVDRRHPERRIGRVRITIRARERDITTGF